MNVQGKTVSGTTGLQRWAVSSIAYLAAGIWKRRRLASCGYEAHDDDGADDLYNGGFEN